jgi:hypothetical protein
MEGYVGLDKIFLSPFWKLDSLTQDKRHAAVHVTGLPVEQDLCDLFAYLLMMEIRLSLSVKIKAHDHSLESIEVDSYKWSNQDSDALTTRTAVYGRALHIAQMVSVDLCRC